MTLKVRCLFSDGHPSWGGQKQKLMSSSDFVVSQHCLLLAHHPSSLQTSYPAWQCALLTNHSNLSFGPSPFAPHRSLTVTQALIYEKNSNKLMTEQESSVLNHLSGWRRLFLDSNQPYFRRFLVKATPGSMMLQWTAYVKHSRTFPNVVDFYISDHELEFFLATK